MGAWRKLSATKRLRCYFSRTRRKSADGVMLKDVDTIVMMDLGFPCVMIHGEIWESCDGFAMGSPLSAG